MIMPEVEVLFWSSRAFPVPVLLPPPQFCRIAVSKKRLYEQLAGSGLVPFFRIVSRQDLLNGNVLQAFPCWIRDFGDGSTSGKGALLAHNAEMAQAWAVLNEGIQEFMCSAYLPGRNFACHIMYDRGHIVKTASYERLEYFMARTVISGISGNIARGRLVSDARVLEVSDAAVVKIAESTGEVMHGMVAVDLREDDTGTPLVTEINLRHVAATSSFAQAGFNLSEAQLMLTLGRNSELGPVSTVFPPDNVLLRDIDGVPLWLPHFQEPGPFLASH
jgi:carbamoyl-phosphate synthase large subunit